MTASRVRADWRPASFLLSHLLAAALLASWLWPVTRSLWEGVDVAAFRLLNGSLNSSQAWDWLWALASTRLFDILIGALMLSLLIRRDWLFSQAQLRPALFTFVALLIVLLTIRTLFTDVAEHFGWQHASPTEQLAGAFQLSDTFPQLERMFEIKDRSSRSFPGDHASVLLIWGLFMGLFARGGRRLLIVALTGAFMLPRLVAGAHWLSDDLVGGVFIALLALGWGYCTPLAAHLAAPLQWLARPVFRLAAHLPLVKRLAVVRAA
jgi:membrane-associated phospholipid phosphatase